VYLLPCLLGYWLQYLLESELGSEFEFESKFELVLQYLKECSLVLMCLLAYLL
jgi:hypothetical protein